MKKVNYDLMIRNSFWKKCRPHLPRTATKVRRILSYVAGEIVSPKITSEDFSDQDCKKILDALKAGNMTHVENLVLEAMKKAREKV